MHSGDEKYLIVFSPFPYLFAGHSAENSLPILLNAIITSTSSPNAIHTLILCCERYDFINVVNPSQ